MERASTHGHRPLPGVGEGTQEHCCIHFIGAFEGHCRGRGVQEGGPLTEAILITLVPPGHLWSPGPGAHSLFCGDVEAAGQKYEGFQDTIQSRQEWERAERQRELNPGSDLSSAEGARGLWVPPLSSLLSFSLFSCLPSFPPTSLPAPISRRDASWGGLWLSG